MKQIPIKVETYSGYKADEYPTSFYIEDQKHIITIILDRWYQGNVYPELPVSNYYKVVTTDDHTFIIKQEIENNKWFLIVKTKNG